MKLTEIVTDCDNGPCPTVYATDRGTLVVQGNRIERSELTSIDMPGHEDAVEVPINLLLEAAKLLPDA